MFVHVLVNYQRRKSNRKRVANYYQICNLAKDKPVVRKHTVVHLMDWLKERTDDVSEETFDIVLVSSTIRNIIDQLFARLKLNNQINKYK